MVDICCILQLSARDVSAQTSRKSAAKCDKHCELQNSVSHENLERTLRFRDIPESMPASLSIHFSYLRAHPWVACRCSRVLVGCDRFICLAIQHMHSSSDRRLSGRRCWLAHVCFRTPWRLASRSVKDSKSMSVLFVLLRRGLSIAS